MSDRFDLRADSTVGWGDVQLADCRSLDDFIDCCSSYGGPFKLVANDALLLRRWVVRTRDRWPQPSDFALIMFEDSNGKLLWQLEYPERAALLAKLKGA